MQQDTQRTKIPFDQGKIMRRGIEVLAWCTVLVVMAILLWAVFWTPTKKKEQGSKIHRFIVQPNGSIECPCPEGYTCMQTPFAENKTCVRPCEKCVNKSIEGYGNHECLQFWKKDENKQKLLNFSFQSVDATSSDSCENVTPSFDLHTSDGSCHVMLKNKCV